MNLLYMHLFWSHSLPILDPGSPSYFPQQETNTEGSIPIESPPPNKCEMESIREGNFTFGNNIFVLKLELSIARFMNCLPRY